MISEVKNMDCIEYMQQFPDKYFELAIVDPPYGIGIDKAINSNKGKQGFKKYKQSNWDEETPNDDYFKELFRISKNQIIWGANYMIDKIKKPSQCWVVWNKIQREFTMSDAELAWTSFDKTVRCFDFSRGSAMGNHNKNGGKIHPTQKPVSLYRWLLQNYAKKGDKIIDTHLGSGSSRIAADIEGFDFYACELDKDYFDASCKRFDEYKQQLKLI